MLSIRSGVRVDITKSLKTNKITIMTRVKSSEATTVNKRHNTWKHMLPLLVTI